MCFWTSRGKTGVAKSNTALCDQGRHLSLKGGRSYAYPHELQPCCPLAFAVDCCFALPIQVGQLPPSGRVGPLPKASPV